MPARVREKFTWSPDSILRALNPRRARLALVSHRIERCLGRLCINPIRAVRVLRAIAPSGGRGLAPSIVILIIAAATPGCCDGRSDTVSADDVSAAEAPGTVAMGEVVSQARKPSFHKVVIAAEPLSRQVDSPGERPRRAPGQRLTHLVVHLECTDRDCIDQLRPGDPVHLFISARRIGTASVAAHVEPPHVDP